MATDVSVCSNALLMLGENPINSFTEGAVSGGLDRARIAQNLWPTVRNALLRSHPWNCAKARVSLSPEATTPAFGYTYQYVLPSKWLRNVEINGVKVDEVDYEVETAGETTGKRLLVNEATLNLKYIWRNEDVTSWDPLLVDCAELAMAMRMAYPITQSVSLRDHYANELFEKLKRARSVDGQDDSPATFGSFEILTARQTM